MTLVNGNRIPENGIWSVLFSALFKPQSLHPKVFFYLHEHKFSTSDQMYIDANINNEMNTHSHSELVNDLL